MLSESRKRKRTRILYRPGSCTSKCRTAAENGAIGQAHDIEVADLADAGMRRQRGGDQQRADDDADIVHADGDGRQPKGGVGLQYAMIKPLTLKMSGVIIIRRTISTISCCCSGGRST